MKEFLKSPKKTAILGLIGSILMLSSWLIYFTPFSVLDKLCSIGLIVYFIIILVRMFTQKGNLKIANYTLILAYILQLVMIIPSIKYAFTVNGIVYVMSLIIVLLYFFNILLRKKNFVNNKIFAVVISLYTLVQLIFVIKSYNFFTTRYSPIVETTIYSINYIAYLFIIPYFYNYYNILKGENKDANKKRTWSNGYKCR